jgi:hypothetical protein
MRTLCKGSFLVFGILGAALGACSQSDSGGGSTGGTSGTGTIGVSTVVGSGGGDGGSGGVPSSSQPSGGSSAQSSSGVAGSSGAASGGTKSTGGEGGTKGGTTGTNTAGGGTSSTATGSGGKTSTGTGGSTTSGSGGTTATGSGGAGGTGGKTGTGGAVVGGSSAGGVTATGGSSGAAGRTSTGSGTCTASKAANLSVTGSGKHKVVVETNSDSAMACGTIYRPEDLGGTEKYPIFVWGEGACSRDGKSNSAAMGEIASHGYFVVADGPLNGGNCASIGMPSTAADLPNMGKPLLGYITWAIAENDKPCSAYFDSLDTSKVAADGFSCGGLMASGTSADPRMTTYGVTSSGLTGPDSAFYGKVHTPFKALTGSTDMAYDNAKRDYQQLSALGVPSVFFSKNGAGHGGDLGDKNGGDFTKVNLAWLNWQLKGDTTATGKGFLIGSGCTFCSNGGWEVMSKNIP